LHLGAAQHARYETSRFIGRSAGAALLFPRAVLVAALVPTHDNVGALDRHERIDAERPADQAKHHHPADADPAGADRHSEPATAAAKSAIAAAIFEVAAFRHVIQAHRDSPSPNPAIVAGRTA